MNEAICGFRFEICDLVSVYQEAWFANRTLLLTPRFSGVCMLLECQNRFSGFERAEKTAEAVQDTNSRPFTLLKPGVNETWNSCLPMRFEVSG